MHDPSIPRRGLLTGLSSGFALALLGTPARAEGAGAPAAAWPEFPSQDPARVLEMVGVSHANIDRVRELVTESPALAKAALDWGFGDWETAIGAASHMGRRDIAEVLMAHGARPDLFTCTMLGDLATVRAAVAARPGVQRIPGPHGITLLQHAKAGGEPARAVVEYLESLGDADPRATSFEVTADLAQSYLGRYVFGPGAEDVLKIATDASGVLTIQRAERVARRLHRVEEHGFAPAGAPAVRVRFAVVEGRAVRVTVHDPQPIAAAERAG